MGGAAMASQITSLTILSLTVYSGADQRKHQSFASLAFVRGIHRWPMNSPHKWIHHDRWIPRTNGQWRGKGFHLMTSPCMFENDGQLAAILTAHGNASNMCAGPSMFPNTTNLIIPSFQNRVMLSTFHVSSPIMTNISESSHLRSQYSGSHLERPGMSH